MSTRTPLAVLAKAIPDQNLVTQLNKIYSKERDFRLKLLNLMFATGAIQFLAGKLHIKIEPFSDNPVDGGQFDIKTNTLCITSGHYSPLKFMHELTHLCNSVLPIYKNNECGYEPSLNFTRSVMYSSFWGFGLTPQQIEHVQSSALLFWDAEINPELSQAPCSPQAQYYIARGVSETVCTLTKEALHANNMGLSCGTVIGISKTSYLVPLLQRLIEDKNHPEISLIADEFLAYFISTFLSIDSDEGTIRQAAPVLPVLNWLNTTYTNTLESFISNSPWCCDVIGDLPQSSMKCAAPCEGEL